MTAVVFAQREGEYFDWILNNPGGYVLNTRRNPDPDYMVLHRATCVTVSRYLGKAKDGGFTDRQFIKVCALTVRELRQWSKAKGASQFSKHCAHCGALPALGSDQTVEQRGKDVSALLKAEQSALANRGFPDAETRAAVEKAAIDHVRMLLRSDGFRVEDHQKENCGYDLLAVRGKVTLLIEVKGTDASQPRFFLTRNERKCSKSAAHWQLRVVTEARRSPQEHVFSAREMEKVFKLDPMAWECTPVEA